MAESQGSAESVACEVDITEGGGGPKAAGNGAVEGVAREVDGAKGGDVAEVGPGDGTSEVSGRKEEGAAAAGGCGGVGRGELEAGDIAESHGDEAAVGCSA